MAIDKDAPKRKLTPAERERYLQIKKRLFELYEEDGKLRAELEKMGLKFERKWWHGPFLNCRAVGETGGSSRLDGKSANFEV